MSEDRPASPATENKAIKQTGQTLVNVNAVIQKALQKMTADDRGSFVVRCDDLPLVHGTEEDFEAIFSTLLTIILERKDGGKKLFLHIHCRSEDHQLTMAGVKPFNIQFHTNLSPGVNWMIPHHQQISEAAALLKKHTASLVVNQPTNGGAIFSVSLLGKSL